MVNFKVVNRLKARLAKMLGSRPISARAFNICIVHPDGAAHRGVFDELAELIHWSLVECSCQSRWGYNLIDHSRINIMIGVHLMDPATRRLLPDMFYVFNTEQMQCVRPEWRETLMYWVHEASVVVDYSRDNIEFFQVSEIRDLRLFRFGLQPQLRRIPMAQLKDIDVLFYGTVNPRRQKILDAMLERGLNVIVLYDVYGDARDEYIARSKVVLNMHYYESEILEVIRIFYLVLNQVVVLTELNESTSLSSDLVGLIQGVPYEHLVEEASQLCQDHAYYSARVEALYGEPQLVAQSTHTRRAFLHV